MSKLKRNRSCLTSSLESPWNWGWDVLVLPPTLFCSFLSFLSSLGWKCNLPDWKRKRGGRSQKKHPFFWGGAKWEQRSEGSLYVYVIENLVNQTQRFFWHLYGKVLQHFYNVASSIFFVVKISLSALLVLTIIHTQLQKRKRREKVLIIFLFRRRRRPQTGVSYQKISSGDFSLHFFPTTRKVCQALKVKKKAKQ